MNAPIREQIYVNGAMSKAWVRYFHAINASVAGESGAVYPETYGAKGDGTTDDTAAIQAAIDAGVSAKVVGSAKTYKITSQITIKGDCDFSQSTFAVYSTPAVAVEVSTGSAANPEDIFENHICYLPRVVENKTKPASGWAAQGIGVRVVNAQNCEIHIGNVMEFATGALITSYTRGNAYNLYYINHLENNQINLDLDCGNAAAWTNENQFFINRLSHYSAEGTDVASTRLIRINKATNPINNNIFYKPNLEGDVAEYHVEIGGSYNTILQGRWEATTPKVHYIADNADQGSSNFIIGGYASQTITYSFDVTGGGKYNGLIGPRQVFYSSALSYKMQNTYSSASPLLTFYESGTAPETAGADDWSFQVGSQTLKGKRKADAYERLKMVFSTAGLFMGDGTGESVKVVGPRQTGVSAMTNVSSPANLDANTVSTAELADIVGNLINKLRTHGLVGD